MKETKTVRLVSIPLAKFEAKSGSHVLAFFTEERGQIRSVVRSSAGKKKPSSPVLPLFSTYEILFREPTARDGLYDLKERETVGGRMMLNSGNPIEPWAAASVFSELLLRTTENGDPHPYLFQMLDKVLDRLEQGQHPCVLMAAFLVKFLEHMGYRPRWEIPDRQDSPLEPLLFDPSMGGLCTRQEWSQPGKHDPPRRSVPPTRVSIKDIEAIQSFRVSKFEDLGGDSADVKTATNWVSLLGDYIEYHLETRLKSLTFWAEIQPKKKK